jgi:hypothetical protein
LTLDYAEITSIPPLPLWTLLAADKERLEQKEDVKVIDNSVYFSILLENKRKSLARNKNATQNIRFKRL